MASYRKGGKLVNQAMSCIEVEVSAAGVAFVQVLDLAIWYCMQDLRAAVARRRGMAGAVSSDFVI